MAVPTKFLVVAFALSLAGCGVAGAPEPPPNGQQAKDAAAAKAAGKPYDTSQPMVPDRKLLIDHLL